MNMKTITVYYGGDWVNQNYVDGESRVTLVPQNNFSFECLMQEVDNITRADRQKIRYVISSLFETSDGGKIRTHIENDLDLKYVVGNSELPTFFITLEPQALETPVRRTNFMSLLNEQSAMPRVVMPIFPQHEQDNQDTSESENYESNDEHISSGADYDVNWDVNDDDETESLDNDIQDMDEVNTLCISSMGISTDAEQWVIPGALYHASLPVEDDLFKCNQFSDDTLSVDSVFNEKKKLLNVLGMYHLHNRFEFVVKRSSQSRFTAVCKISKTCPFSIRASANRSLWRITNWEPKHTCHMDFSTHGPRTVSAKTIGAYFAPRLLTDGVVLRATEMAAELKRSFGVQVDYKLALNGRNHAIQMIYGDPKKSFGVLPSYLHMINETNPGSKVALQTDSVNRFEYMFMALAVSISGFLSSCRPVIVVDGTHLKGKYNGVMFVAATKDGNEQIFPLAIGVGDKENDAAWIWFFRQLRRTFGCPRDLLIVSDQHVSIKNAIAAVYPGVAHGICVYHLQKNLGRFSKEVIALFQRAAYCYKVSDFEKHMKALQEGNEHAAHLKLLEANPVKWAKSKCTVRRFKFETSNCAESINNRLRWARRLPVCTMLECVRTMVGRWIIDRRTEAVLRSHDLTEYAANKLENAVEIGRTMEVEPISICKFKVVYGDHTFVVDLGTKTCSCREFDIELIPCSHAAAAIFKSKQSYMSYVSSYYTMVTYRKTYAGEVYPIPHPEEWKVPDEIKRTLVRFPKQPKQAGRPRVKRMQGGFECTTKASSKICSRCNKSGHNRATCSAKIPIQQQDQIAGPKRKKSCSICRATNHNKRRCPNVEREVN